MVRISASTVLGSAHTPYGYLMRSRDEASLAAITLFFVLLALVLGLLVLAYRTLRDAVALDPVEQFNGRLALALGADARSSDAARILRPGAARTGSPGIPLRRG